MHSSIDLWAQQRNSAQVLPSGCKLLLDATPEGGAVVRLWMPKASKPFASYRFTTLAAAWKYVYEQDERVTAHKERVAAAKAERRGTPAQIAGVRAGDIFHHSWGYEQTNADFYQVVAKEGRHLVVREVAARRLDTPRPTGPMSDYCEPVKDAFLEGGEPMRKLLQFSGGKPYITVSSCGWCSLWDGRPVRRTWYA